MSSRRQVAAKAANVDTKTLGLLSSGRCSHSHRVSPKQTNLSWSSLFSRSLDLVQYGRLLSPRAFRLRQCAKYRQGDQDFHRTQEGL